MFSKIFAEWKKEAQVFNDSPWMKRLSNGTLKLCHYKGYLLESYHHAGLNPQIQAFATMYLKNNPRETINTFFKHASSEIGHDLLACNDLINLDVKKEKILSSRPLPSTIALNAYVLYQIQFVSAVSYLGYLFHLEFMPTQSGPDYIKNLTKMGVPENALTFLIEHATVDEAHNKLMEKYVKTLIKDEESLQQVIEAAKNSCHLHLKMVEESFENGEKIF